ncbi:hypothetical protein IFT64_20415 [Oxalobacteraceae sp. CFBP 8753]|nr:hypothetical protein [Oxalobacteraceae sp. CFBP 8753]
MRPQIEFKHVLGELSVNRNDPCEVLRELISNSYDAKASNLIYVPLKDRQGFAFLDDGTGLDAKVKVNGITPWEAFFSIGKSTKKQGDSIGYKCQGSKLCFACGRILVASTSDRIKGEWIYKSIDNPRVNLDTSFDITPSKTKNIGAILDEFMGTATADTAAAIQYIKDMLSSDKPGSAITLILIDNLETESYLKHFAVGANPGESYVYNYIRFYTRHGDVRYLTNSQGYSASQRTQVSNGIKPAEFEIFSDGISSKIPFGYPYLDKGSPDPNLKGPAQVARLRDGRFYSRAAKKFSVGPNKFSIVMAIDGNRRAHDEYPHLGRKGQGKSGIRLGDQRGLFIAVKGIKICKYPDLLTNIDGYEVLSEGDAPSHYTIILDGDFDLVTNRSALSKRAYDTLADPNFIAEVKKFLDAQKSTDQTFSELLSRLRRESSETLLNEQIELLEKAKSQVKSRERIRFKDSEGVKHLFLSPLPGEEYLVGVLYSQLASMANKNPEMESYWRRVITFSTQGIDSLGLLDENASAPLVEKNICSIEYKYEFNNTGSFNHALAVVDFIVAWSVNVDVTKRIEDSFTCFGNIRKVDGNDFEWEIYDVENKDGGTYENIITVIDLKGLIMKTFDPKISKPS